ncbi:unnamed protein product [Pocillopora meandrina]|uniref:Transposase n=1 Tax=Pocillopora meandrina TaxID=46732 RepID=A0AAU9Y3L5_9CNID|nr:unnamed protein product [Pocillopora meandrina]
MDDDSVYKYIRKLMALPFLPYPEIQPMFDLLEEQAQTDQLGRLFQYIRRQWIESEVFTPRNWCVYKEPVRTNNDLEGWHNALNRRAGGQCGLPLYLLIELLDRKAKLTAITIRLVSDNKLKRIQRRTTRNIQAKLFASWEKYENNEKTAAQLLRTCSRLCGPARSN